MQHSQDVSFFYYTSAVLVLQCYHKFRHFCIKKRWFFINTGNKNINTLLLKTSAVSLNSSIFPLDASGRPGSVPDTERHYKNCIWFGLALSAELHPLMSSEGYPSLTSASHSISHSSVPPVSPSHLLQLSNHPMTFKGAWHPFEVGEGGISTGFLPKSHRSQ